MLASASHNQQTRVRDHCGRISVAVVQYLLRLPGQTGQNVEDCALQAIFAVWRCGEVLCPATRSPTPSYLLIVPTHFGPRVDLYSARLGDPSLRRDAAWINWTSLRTVNYSDARHRRDSVYVLVPLLSYGPSWARESASASRVGSK
jgi:hypothetical protein